MLHNLESLTKYWKIISLPFSRYCYLIQIQMNSQMRNNRGNYKASNLAHQPLEKCGSMTCYKTYREKLVFSIFLVLLECEPNGLIFRKVPKTQNFVRIPCEIQNFVLGSLRDFFSESREFFNRSSKVPWISEGKSRNWHHVSSLFLPKIPIRAR